MEKDYSLEQLKKLAFHDELTKVYNRRYFKEQFEIEMQRITRYNRELTLLMLDIDHFKGVNDTFGHLVGDEVIKIVAKVLEKSVRDTDKVFRYAGDEFVVLLPEATKEGSLIVAERMLQMVQETQYLIKNKRVPISISIGVANYPSDTEQAEKLLTLADKALYNSKKAGRGRVSTVTDTIDEKEKKEYVFIGRGKEIQTLEEKFSLVEEGKGQSVIVRGEIGMGKTSTIYQFVEKIERGHRHSFFRGKCKKTSTISYQPIREILSKIYTTKEIIFYSSFNNLVDEQKEEIKSLISDFEQKFENRRARKTDEHSLYFSIYKFLQGVAEVEPLILSFEEIQFLDKETLLLIQYLVRNLKDSRILFVFTTQPDETVFEFVSNLLLKNENVSLLELKNLSKSEIEKLLSYHNIPLTLTNEIQELSAGIPIFLKELVKFFKTTNETKFDKKKLMQELPQTLKGIIQRRFDKFDSELSEVLEVISVIGDDCSLKTLEKVSGVSEGHLYEILDKLLDFHVIQEDERGATEIFNFSLQLESDFIYNQISEERKKELHLKTARTIEKIYIQKIEKFYEQLTRHYKVVGDSQKTLSYALLSASKSKSVYSNEIASNYYKLANEILEKELKKNPTDEDLLEKYYVSNFNYLEILEKLYELEKTKEILDKLLRVSKDLNDPIKISDIYLKLAKFEHLKGEFSKGKTLLEKSLKLKEEANDLVGMALAYRILGNFNLDNKFYLEALKHYKKSLELAQKIGDQNLICTSIGSVGIMYDALGNFEKAKEYLNQSYKIAYQIDNKETLITTAFNLGNLEARLGYFEKSILILEEGLKVVKQVDSKREEVNALDMLAETYKNIGNFSAAREKLEKAISLATEIGNKAQKFLLTLNLSELYAEVEDLENAEIFLKEAEKISQEINVPEILEKLSSAKIKFLFVKKDYSECLKELDKFDTELENYTLIHIYLYQSYCYLNLGDLHKAKEIADKMIEQLEFYSDFNSQENWFLAFKVYEKLSGKINSELAEEYLQNAHRIVSICERRMFSQENQSHFLSKKPNAEIIAKFRAKKL